MHAKLVDGFTFTMPDTPQNQAAYPQMKAQKPGVGLPIARATAIVSLATACVMDLAIAPYQGKETGESALLRSMLGSLSRGDIAVMDRYDGSFLMIALLLGQGTQTCARKHHLRHSDFRRGQRLGKQDHLVVWTRPQRPAWMNEETYQQIPEKLILRELRFHIVEPGRLDGVPHGPKLLNLVKLKSYLASFVDFEDVFTAETSVDMRSVPGMMRRLLEGP